MSVTPDFIGQVYKDTSNGNLWRANSTTPGDWTLELQNMQVDWESKTLKLGEMIGFLTYGDLPGITSITFLGSTTLGGCDIESTSLIELRFPNLISIDPTGFTNGIDYITNNNNLTTVDFSSLVTCGLDFDVDGNPALVSLDVSSLATVGGSFYCNNNPSLTSINLSSFVSLVGHFYCNGNAFTASTVEHILNVLVSLGPTFTGHTISLNGGTNAGLASLSAQGQADKSTLQARPNTVNINP